MAKPRVSIMHHPNLFRHAMNLWPPYLGAGIRVRHIAGDWRTINVSLTRHWYNRNYMGTHFGGSLFAMTDPFYMLMLIRNLGSAYAVWDKSSQVEFIKAVRQPVAATFMLDQNRIDTIKAKTASGDKHFESFAIDVKDGRSNIVARVEKTVYIRRKAKQ